MGFENVYASSTDVNNYGLNEIWDRYHPLWKGEYYRGNKPALTIDRNRKIFLVSVGQGSGDDGNRIMFLLWWNGHHIRIDLKLASGSSGNLGDNPFFRVWDLVYKDIPKEFMETEEEVISTLKQAVTVYGYRGVKRQIENTVVRFNF